MRRIIVTAIAVIALAVVAAPASPAAAERSSCSDVGYLNGALKSAKKDLAALKLARKSRFAAALVPARTGLWFAKNAAMPCDEGTNSYWLHRQYAIKYNVALVRYLEEMRDGNSDAADTYWSGLDFWSDEMHDIQLSW